MDAATRFSHFYYIIFTRRMCVVARRHRGYSILRLIYFIALVFREIRFCHKMGEMHSCTHVMSVDLTSNASFSNPKWMAIRRRLLQKNTIFNRKIRIMQASPGRRKKNTWSCMLQRMRLCSHHIMFNTHFIASFASNDAIFFSRISLETAVRVDVFTCVCVPHSRTILSVAHSASFRLLHGHGQ